jgi:hypothetical protein
MEHDMRIEKYGDYKILSVNGAGDTLRVLVEHVETGVREYRVASMKGMK